MDRDDKKKQLIHDYRETFGSESGKRVFEHLKQCAKFNVAYLPKDNQGRTDIYEMMRQNGKRAVITHIELMLTKDPYEKKGIKHG